MSSGIFLIRDNEALVELTSMPYDSEALLQGLLEQYPNLLVGDQIDPVAPRRWLLVTREAGVPSELDGGDRWSIDHLFLDQDAVPTLVEVKRSSDTRIRREVVGQMLDYAANGVAYWPVETIRALFEAREQAAGRDAAATLAAFLGPEGSPESFWQRAKTNLQAGRIRLVFLADEIPAELRRVVEFLNAQMDPAEVLAVEVKQFVGGAFRGLVPRVIGRTEQSERHKSATSGTPERQWDEVSLLAELGRRFGDAEVSVARRLLDWARASGSVLWWGRGAKHGSVYVGVGRGGKGAYPFAIWTYGRVEMQLGALAKLAPFDGLKMREELGRRLNEISGVEIASESLSKRPSFPLAMLSGDDAFGRFTGAMSWIGEQIP
jgi:hypothetical protein